MACLETKLQQLLAASFLLTGAAVLIRQNRDVPTDVDEYTFIAVKEDIDGTPGEPRKAHTEWWTAHPPAGRRRGSDLPQCCGSLEKGGDGKWCAKRTDGFEVPSYVGPAPANFRFEPEQLKEALRGRRVVLIGDSLTLQWSKMLGCYLTGDDHRNEYSKADGPLWNATREKIQRLREKLYPLPNDDRTFVFYRLPLGGPGDGEIVTYVSHGFWPSIAEGFLALHARYPEERADLVIINQGAHFNNPSLNPGSSSLYEDLVGYMELCRAEGLRCVLRESSAQHFWYNDTKLQSGLYKPGKQRQCISSRYNESERALFYDSLAEWRRDDLTAALEHVGQPERVMRIFDATVPLTYAHPLQDDCTHYALDTEYWEPWHAALFGLVEELPTK